AIHQCVADAVEDLAVGFGKVAMPLRIAVTGGAPSPELDLTVFLVGREATLRRIDRAISYIQGRG
ncbi:MAG: glutamate--tRNA ligase, partial [Sedimenticolaceae bacterium]